MQWSRAVAIGARATTEQLYPGRDTLEFDQGHQKSTNHSSRFVEWKSGYITMLNVRNWKLWSSNRDLHQRGRKRRKIFLEGLFFFIFFFFCILENKILVIIFDIIGLEISHCLSANHNPELPCVICTGITLFATVLHLSCTDFSQLESGNLFYVCY